VNEVIGIDIAATMERGILEGLAEANTHSQRSLYENCSAYGSFCYVVLKGRSPLYTGGPLVTKREKQALDGSVRV